MEPNKIYELAVIEEVISMVRFHVVNQVRYQVPDDLVSKLTWDKMVAYADTDMTDESSLVHLKGKSILDSNNLIKLAADIGVEALYDGDGWVDAVSDYIVSHRADCMELWAAQALGAAGL